MSPPWSKPLDVEHLADGGADIDFVVPLAELPRLGSRHPGVTGTVSGRAHFLRDAGFAVADLTVNGTATVTCQRCLRAMDEPVDSHARIALVASEAEVSRVPEHLEPVLAAGGRISLAELVEEELLLALPIVSTHPAPAGCGGGAPPEIRDSSGEQAQHTQRPFEKLGELIKRS